VTKKLTVHNAEITTATVEIKTLTVGGKQVTLAVFRQLREEPLITEDGTLKGVPWGTVNYHPDKCGDQAGHWHVVWQSGSDLLRARVAMSVEFPLWDSETGHRYLTTCVWEHVHGGTQHFNNAPLLRDKTMDFVSFQHSRVIEIEGVDTVLRTSSEATTAAAAQEDLLAIRRRSDQPDGSPYLERAQERFDLALPPLEEQYQFIGAQTANQMYEALKEECRAEAARRRRHRDIRATLAELPQLFIAV